ncbi:MAG TPA: helicase C-terminal domain-containing protein [Patescibacteria group bacterium]|nr:helicase C-terminal domain-containing protein [Patescibacteria group bacterium]
MPRVVRCPVCERRHTIEEYEEDRFCRTCGALLELGPAERRGGKGWRELFPYEPYPPQVKFMDDVERVLGSGGTLIAEACNGFGKTASSLAVLLSMGRPVVYATRTHEQVRQVLTEVSTINEKAGKRFTAVNLASRQHLCLNPECSDLPVRDAQELCRLLRDDGECPWASEVTELPRGLPPVLTKEALISAGKRRSICPYYLARRASKSCRMVVVPYPYIFNKGVRGGVGLDLAGRALVLDEGHNLDKVGQETMSDTLSEVALDIASEELKAIKMSTRHMQRLARLLRQKTSEKPTLERPEQLERDLELALSSDLERIIDHYSEAVEKIRAHKLSRGDLPASYLNGVLTFLSLVASSSKGKYVALYQRDRRGVNTLTYRCLDPSLAIQPVIEEVDGALIMSGTLSPLDLFAEVVGLEKAEKKAYPPIQNPDKIRMVIDPGVTTTYRERSNEMILSIGRRIAEEVQGVDGGALLFFPQRGFMNTCLDAWGTNGVIETRGGRLLLGDKDLFIEGSSARSNRDIVPRFKRSAVTANGAVLCCVFRGRNSEGSNFPGRQARGIFLVGVPYANYGDPIVRAQIGYYNRQSDGMGQRWYAMDAYRAANQALGRGIRGIDDWCHYWLLDRRYVEGINFISKWALGNGPEFIDPEIVPP